ncbi:MAG TPA: hypothetical protein VI876_02835 [Dehalococcoidia bacterium]|nr:hypothetical protein [Dehalococcoidia bacterium]
MLVVALGVALLVINVFALRIQRRHTHSSVWHRTIERLRAGHPSLLLGWQRYDRLGRALNLAGLILGLVLITIGLAAELSS